MFEILNTLKIGDMLFILLAAFFLTVLSAPFYTPPEEGWKYLLYLIEVYIIIVVVFTFVYAYLKERSNDASYLVQERMFAVLFFVLITIVVLISGREVYSQRKTKHGIVFFVGSIIGAIIFVVALMANSAITERYSTNFQHPFTMLEMGRYGKVADSYR